jgi:hypothetical protein
MADPNGTDSRPVWFLADVTATKSRHTASVTAPFAFSYKNVYDKDGTLVRPFGPDICYDLFWMGPRVGIYEKRGTWLVLPDNFPGEKAKVQGSDGWLKLYREHVIKYPEWVEAQLDYYYLQRWYDWCADAGKNAHEYVQKFGDAVYDRFVEHEQEVLKITGHSCVAASTRALRAPTLGDEMANLEQAAAAQEKDDAMEVEDPVDDTRAADTQEKPKTRGRRKSAK